ncbi:hypothetical protein DPX16_5165 [Anabarilius grahami]|uniref:Uncharacterized protein n=1 Tax=Anabarilius grahami TaxID=495550 RepID=A0A3N0XLB1_ANAGA|nr:hypothetical protein DPX16_5165 [Anabarilius grahami]
MHPKHTTPLQNKTRYESLGSSIWSFETLIARTFSRLHLGAHNIKALKCLTVPPPKVPFIPPPHPTTQLHPFNYFSTSASSLLHSVPAFALSLVSETATVVVYSKIYSARAFGTLSRLWDVLPEKQLSSPLGQQLKALIWVSQVRRDRGGSVFPLELVTASDLLLSCIFIISCSGNQQRN